MTPEAVERRLAAIISADAVGYSRLMARDGAATLRTLNAYRGAMGGLVRQYGGRVVGTAGDNLLAEFKSVVDAVSCAVGIQKDLDERNAELPAEQRMDFRIGIHLGDVMVEGEQIYGDGVNVAARLEGLAEPGGICVSRTVYEQVRANLCEDCEDLGEQSLKNIAHPVRVYRLRTKQEGSAVAAADLTVPGFAGRPAIAVLPFDNLSGDPEQEYFADGIVEDLITRLSGWRLFPVIARNSTFAYKGKAIDVKKVSRELGVRYVVEGSVRKAGERVRITTQLIDATTGHHVWADRYDRKLDDIFALQDEITETVVAAIEPALGKFERQRAIKQDPKNLAAWDCVQRGWWHLDQLTPEEIKKARELFIRATELDPQFSAAFSTLALSIILEVLNQWAESTPDSMKEALEAAKRSVALDTDDPSARHTLGWCYGITGEYERAIMEHERAMELNPSSARLHWAHGNALTNAGRPHDGIGMIEKAIRLSPKDPFMHVFIFHLAFAHFFAGEYEKAVEQARDSLRLVAEQSHIYRMLASCYGYLDRPEEGKAAMKKACEIAPHFSLERSRLVNPPAVIERLVDGWRKAGLEM